ncbi:hypothetical protein AVEN_86083-1, partial [Araneus ventricosus]
MYWECCTLNHRYAVKCPPTGLICGSLNHTYAVKRPPTGVICGS